MQKYMRFNMRGVSAKKNVCAFYTCVYEFKECIIFCYFFRKKHLECATCFRFLQIQELKICSF